jgi:hypothetical protein
VARRSAVVWAVLAVVFAGVLSLVAGLAVNAVPDSWGWAHDWWLLIGVSAGFAGGGRAGGRGPGTVLG